jgi:hypothetical protein
LESGRQERDGAPAGLEPQLQPAEVMCAPGVG